MIITECYQCGRWQFITDQGAVWIKPSLEDVLAVQLIEKSKLLTALIKELKIYSTLCEDCSSEQLN